jgi:hypothetical protein
MISKLSSEVEHFFKSENVALKPQFQVTINYTRMLCLLRNVNFGAIALPAGVNLKTDRNLLPKPFNVTAKNPALLEQNEANPSYSIPSDLPITLEKSSFTMTGNEYQKLENDNVSGE